MGAGKYARMMRRRGSGFRFLHDEISGGVAAYSQMITRAAYTGDAVEIGTTGNEVNYGFSPFLVDKAAIASAWPSSTALRTWYDQIGANDTGSTTGGWDGSDFVLMPNSGNFRKQNPTGALATIGNGAFTLVAVCKANDFTNEFVFRGNAANTLRAYWISSTRFLFRLGNNPRIDFDNIPVSFDNQQHLMVFTYDGSALSSGLQVYEDDMINPISGGTRASVGTYANTPIFSSEFDLGIFLGLKNDVHVFDKVLSQSERVTLKEILLQNPTYTFS
jgi:hypothetical protein